MLTCFTRTSASSTPRVLVALVPLCVGCGINHYQPRHFDFVSVVEKTEPGPGGWRAACLHAPIVNTRSWETYLCRLGVGMPMETATKGPISEALAQRIAADCANDAGRQVLEFPNSPRPGAVCEEFKATFHSVLSRSVAGSRVTTLCDGKTHPQVIEF